MRRALPQKPPQDSLRRVPGEGHARRIRSYQGKLKVGDLRAHEEGRCPLVAQGRNSIIALGCCSLNSRMTDLFDWRRAA